MTTTGHLTTGWEPDLDVGDTLVRRYLFHHADTAVAFTAAAGGRTLETADMVATHAGRPNAYWNGAVLLRPPADWSAVLDAVDVFAGDGPGEVSLFSAWPTPDLGPRGWELSGHPPLLVRPPVDLVPLPEAPPVDLRRVGSVDDLRRWEQVAVEGYPLPSSSPGVPGCLAPPALLDDDRLALWLGRRGDVAVHAGAAFTSRGLVSLAFGATRPEARRQGFWLRSAVERLQGAPHLWAAGVFSDLSRPGAERLGFVPVCRLTLWIRPSGARRAALDPSPTVTRDT